MDFRFTPEQEAFRSQVHQLIADEWTAELQRDAEITAKGDLISHPLQQRLGARGSAHPHWPRSTAEWA